MKPVIAAPWHEDEAISTIPSRMTKCILGETKSLVGFGNVCTGLPDEAHSAGSGFSIAVGSSQG